MREKLDFKIKNNREELKMLNRSIRTFLSTIKIPPKTIYKVDLILEEMITNIIKYGYNDNKDHEIEIKMNITKEYIRIRIIDDGKEFDSEISPAPNIETPLEEMRLGGLGLHLVKNIIHNMKYKRHKKKNVLRVKLETLSE